MGKAGRATGQSGKMLTAPAPAFASAARGSPKCSSLLPIPWCHACSNNRKLTASKSTLELSATGTGRPLFPQLPKGSSTATRPTLSSGKGLPSSLSFILWACAGCQHSRQPLLPRQAGDALLPCFQDDPIPVRSSP